MGPSSDYASPKSWFRFPCWNTGGTGNIPSLGWAKFRQASWRSTLVQAEPVPRRAAYSYYEWAGPMVWRHVSCWASLGQGKVAVGRRRPWSCREQRVQPSMTRRSQWRVRQILGGRAWRGQSLSRKAETARDGWVLGVVCVAVWEDLTDMVPLHCSWMWAGAA